MPWGNTARKRKFIKGAPVLGIVEAIHATSQGRYLMFHDKPMHPLVIRNWSIVQIEGACRSGRLHHADPNPEYVDPKPQETEVPF